MIKIDTGQQRTIFHLVNTIISLAEIEELSGWHPSLLLHEFKHHSGFFVATHDLLELVAESTIVILVSF